MKERIDVDLGRHGPFHNVRLSGQLDDPVLWLEVPGAAVLCLTADSAGNLVSAILEALVKAGLRKPELSAADETAQVTRALIYGALGIAASGVAIPEEEGTDGFPRP